MWYMLFVQYILHYAVVAGVEGKPRVEPHVGRNRACVIVSAVKEVGGGAGAEVAVLFAREADVATGQARQE